ncbi:hypothetical protein BOTBODRAFT_48236 [Botryobasidium botryosum FD-172 SS1]|uniref:Uncharacterized protein n=1 Tax=Botryobasidium botryosum (strain FD-172 SS1) TaxID=930990 RepID=A0A067M980_BOTB1|nr:hypothetical protein BOTBODRAFT_48236 [Botryobasidium botryosum FD-172 SS1]
MSSLRSSESSASLVSEHQDQEGQQRRSKKSPSIFRRALHNLTRGSREKSIPPQSSIEHDRESSSHTKTNTTTVASVSKSTYAPLPAADDANTSSASGSGAGPESAQSREPTEEDLRLAAKVLARYQKASTPERGAGQQMMLL